MSPQLIPTRQASRGSRKIGFCASAVGREPTASHPASASPDTPSQPGLPAISSMAPRQSVGSQQPLIPHRPPPTRLASRGSRKIGFCASAVGREPNASHPASASPDTPCQSGLPAISSMAPRQSVGSQQPLIQHRLPPTRLASRGSRLAAEGGFDAVGVFQQAQCRQGPRHGHIGGGQGGGEGSFRPQDTDAQGGGL